MDSALDALGTLLYLLRVIQFYVPTVWPKYVEFIPSIGHL
jgi:hypothetical protein